MGGYIPAMEKGDVIGHEFMGEVVDVGPNVTKHKVGDRIVVASFFAAASAGTASTTCTRLRRHQHQPGDPEELWGFSPGGIYGYSHALGGYMGSHAEYIRVPFADVNAFAVPEGVPDDRAVFASDAVATGWADAELGQVKPGDVVAVWGDGAVGQSAARAASCSAPSGS